MHFFFHIIARTLFPTTFLASRPHPASCPTPDPFASVPAERDVSGPVPSLLHQRFMKLTASAGVDGCPAVLTVVLQTGHIGAEEGSELPPTAGALALITQLVVQDVWLHFHLDQKGKMD